MKESKVTTHVDPELEGKRAAEKLAEPKAQVPSICRWVVYTSVGDKEGKYPSQAHPALIVGVYKRENGQNVGLAFDGVGHEEFLSVDLKVETQRGFFYANLAPYSAEPKPGHWHWPPRA